MASFVIDSKMFRDMYGTEEMRKVFSDENEIQCWLDFWVALAKAEADAGVIPADAVPGIEKTATYKNIDMDKVREGFKTTSHPLMPQLRQFSAACPPESGRWVHWGATTQDVMDSAVVLQIKQAEEIIEKHTKQMLHECLVRAKQNRDVVMAGRTHGQQAVPITMGYKFAVVADELGRHLERLEEGKKRYLRVQFGGAAGGLNSLYDKGLEVRKGVAKYLGLYEPTVTWHVARDGFAEFAADLSMIAGTVGKVANEFINLERTEIGEVEEGFTMGKVGSSTMPQKRNPMISENALANCRLVQGNAAMMMPAMIQEHERDMSFWQSDWSVIAQCCIVLDSALEMMNGVLKDMIERKQDIDRNLHMSKGLIVSERVMLDLGESIGRNEAHEVVYECCMKAFEEDRPLIDLLLQDERVTSKVSEKELRELVKPENYTGSCGKMVDLVCDKYKEYL